MNKNNFNKAVRFALSKTILLFATVIFGMLTLVCIRVHPIIAAVMLVFFILFFSLLIEKRKVERYLDKKLNQ